MKKVLGIVMLAVCMIFASCNSCSTKERQADELTYTVGGLNVEQVNALSQEWVATNVSQDYRWLECCIDLENFMDEGDSNNVAGVVNIFSVVKEDPDGKSGGVMIYSLAYTKDTVAIDSVTGLWVGDEPMNAFNPMKIDFAHAYDLMMKANIVKPHGKHCVLRKEVGPIECDPVYIFGNPQAQVYVKATTGEVTANNPAFPPDYEEDIDSCL